MPASNPVRVPNFGLFKQLFYCNYSINYCHFCFVLLATESMLAQGVAGIGPLLILCLLAILNVIIALFVFSPLCQKIR